MSIREVPTRKVRGGNKYNVYQLRLSSGGCRAQQTCTGSAEVAPHSFICFSCCFRALAAACSAFFASFCANFSLATRSAIIALSCFSSSALVFSNSYDGYQASAHGTANRFVRRTRSVFAVAVAAAAADEEAIPWQSCLPASSWSTSVPNLEASFARTDYRMVPRGGI